MVVYKKNLALVCFGMKSGLGVPPMIAFSHGQDVRAWSLAIFEQTATYQRVRKYDPDRTYFRKLLGNNTEAGRDARDPRKWPNSRHGQDVCAIGTSSCNRQERKNPLGKASPQTILGRAAFTLLEILVVITIIVILAGLLISGIPTLKKHLMKISTRSTIASALTALEGQKAAGSLSAPICHPLAASATCGHFFGVSGERAFFYRSRARTGVNAFDEVPRTGGLITASNAVWLPPADLAKQMFPDDIFAGSYEKKDVPLLYGLRRDLCMVLAPGAEWISSYRELPDLVDATGTISILYSKTAASAQYRSYMGTTADHDSVYPDREFLRAAVLPPGQTYESLSEEVFIRNLSMTLSELTAKRAVMKTPDSSTVAPIFYSWRRTDTKGNPITGWMTRQVDYSGPLTGSGRWDPCHRVHFPDETGDSTWSGGYGASIPGSRMKINLGNGVAWYRYRPRGTFLVDAYGTELLYCRDAYGNIKLLSAGPDGCFLLHPGENGTIDTEMNASTYDADTGTFKSFAGDDTDASKDNIP